MRLADNNYSNRSYAVTQHCRILPEVPSRTDIKTYWASNLTKPLNPHWLAHGLGMSKPLPTVLRSDMPIPILCRFVLFESDSVKKLYILK